MRANFGAEPARDVPAAAGTVLHAEGEGATLQALPPWGGIWALESA
jgi:hypothetical protein